MAKNQTRYKTFDVMNNDPRVTEVFDEGEDGIWVYLEPGWTAERGEAHDIHENTVKEVMARYRGIVKCDCAVCMDWFAKRPKCPYCGNPLRKSNDGTEWCCDQHPGYKAPAPRLG